MTQKLISQSDLFEAIVQLKKEYYAGLIEHLLEYKWRLGEMLSIAHVQQETYKDVEAKTGINTTEQSRCINFYKKYPDKSYAYKAWREHIKELSSADEPKQIAEPKCKHCPIHCH